MRCRTNVIVLGIDLSYYYNLILGMMTEIFKSLIGFLIEVVEHILCVSTMILYALPSASSLRT